MQVCLTESAPSRRQETAAAFQKTCWRSTVFSFAAGIVYYLFMYPSMTTVRTWLQCSWEASALCSCLSSCASMTQKFRPQEAGTQTPLILFLDFSNQIFVLHTADVIAVLSVRVVRVISSCFIAVLKRVFLFGSIKPVTINRDSSIVRSPVCVQACARSRLLRCQIKLESGQDLSQDYDQDARLDSRRLIGLRPA